LDDEENETSSIPSDDEQLKEGSILKEDEGKTSKKKKSSQNSNKHRFAGNTITRKRSSSLTRNLKLPLKEARQSKPRFEKRRAALIRAGATDLYQTCMTNHFKVLHDIGLLTKTNAMLTNRLKEMSTKFRENRDQFTYIDSNMNVDSLSLLKRMMNQAISQS